MALDFALVPLDFALVPLDFAVENCMQADKLNFCTIEHARGRHSKNAEIYIF